MTAKFVFRRPDLAARMADVALGLDPLAGDSGLFLAAPRRTGKSTFLQADLVPELERRRVLPIYVDLWSDRDRDPSELVLDALKDAVRNLASPLAKVARKAGLTKAGIGPWLSFEVDTIGISGGATLTDILRALGERNQRPVVLIVDEAQHALTTKAGLNAMFALKSARDTLNADAPSSWSGNVRLGLVFTGSNRDKLASLVLGKNQPFFGSTITDFPLLGRDYTDAYVDYVNRGLTDGRKIDPNEAHEAFKVGASRPQILQASVRTYALGSIGIDADHGSLVQQAIAAREAYWSEFDAMWEGSSDLQRAVLTRLIEKTDAFRPFDAASLWVYSDSVQRDIVTSDVQSALNALRDKGAVVYLDRGRYSLEDISMAEWFKHRFTTQTE